MSTRTALVKLVADVTGAKAGIAETSRDLKRFGEYTAEATVKIQTEAAQANLDKLNTRLKRYQEQPHTADVKIRMGTVARQIERTELQLRQLTEKPHEIRVKANERSFLRVRERIGKLSFGDTVGRAGGAAFAAAGLGAGVFEAVKSVTEAYNTEQASQARLRTQLTALNVDYETHAERIDAVIQRTSQLSGLTGHDLNDAFTNIVRSTGKVGESLHLVGLAADIARAKNIDVAKAGQLVAKVAAGSTSALGRYGIVIKKGATATEALGILQHKFGGQAEAYGKTQKGALDRVNVAFEHLREVIGVKLAPLLTRAANATAKFVTQMSNGTGAGGRFVRQLRNIAQRIGSIVRFLNHHRTAIAVAIGAWAIYRAAAAAALVATRLRLIGMFLGLGGRAAEGGAIAGSRFGAGFAATAARGILSFGWGAIGAVIGGVMVSAITDKIASHFNLTNNVGTPQSLVGREIHSILGHLGIGGGSSGSPSYQDLAVDGSSSQRVSVKNNRVTAVSGPGPARVGDAVSVGNSGHGMVAYPAAGAFGNRVTIHDRGPSSAPGGRDPRGVFPTHTSGNRHRRPRTAADILAGLGSPRQVESRNLHLGLTAAERAYVKAVQQHGANSPQAAAAAGDVVSARQSLHDFEHPTLTATQRAARRRRRRRAGSTPAGAGAATPGDLASEQAAQHYADVVRRYGAGSPQALRARREGNVTTARATIQSITTRLASDLHKYGAGSEAVAKDRTLLARAQVRLTTATEQLTKAIKKGTDQNAALLPKLTDVAYHPISGRMQHAPAQTGVGAAGGHVHHHETTVQVSTPGGMQYPDPEAFAAAVQRKLAAKGNG